MPFSIPPCVQLLRPRQWIKNSFVFAPLLFSGLFNNTEAILQTLLCFVVFCAASSTAYVVNDLKDIEADRSHPLKRLTRPLANGTVTPKQALGIALVMVLVAMAGIYMLPALAFPVAAYLALNLAYSHFLKHQPVLDLFSIAGGFVLRVVGGAAALSVELSSWMMITTLCLTLYLAAMKRRQELLETGNKSRLVLQTYTPQLVERFAVVAATCATVFYSLFAITVKPGLDITIPFVLFGLFRYWYVADTQTDTESPTDILLRDVPLLLTVLAWVCMCLVVIV